MIRHLFQVHDTLICKNMKNVSFYCLILDDEVLLVFVENQQLTYEL